MAVNSTASSNDVAEMCNFFYGKVGLTDAYEENGNNQSVIVRAVTHLPTVTSIMYENGTFIGSGIQNQQEEDNAIKDTIFAISRIVTPLFCGFGIIGNLLNILVLTRRRMQAGSDSSSERAAFMGLIALAISDLCYCTSAFPNAFLKTKFALFRSGDPRMYHYLYKYYILNTFSKISTWLTVIMAVSRYVAICHPLHARLFVHAKGTALAICFTFILWFLLELPECWTNSVTTTVCPKETFFIIDSGTFVTDKHMNITFQYLWFVLGFVVPVCILTFCNVQLIKALRASLRMRQQCRVHGGRQHPGKSITPTLIAIVLMFIFLMTPSEIIHFMSDVLKVKSKEHEALLVVTNLMNTINFSLNFVLYCVVNVHFRSTLIDLICCCFPKTKRINRFCAPAYSAVTSKTEFPLDEQTI